MRAHRIIHWITRRSQSVDQVMARHGASRSVTLAAIGVSVAAGIVLALGGLLHRPALWLAVPPLVLIRLALGAVQRSVLRRAMLYPIRMEETLVEVPAPSTIEDEMLHALGR